MSLKILIADDSMTAQNMGKKILADAGFDVVPVSNGAAAVKKIAETKPDIIIVDIFMPGYTGLEVCDKVKNSPETANVPVLLTVGKLEPYRPEDGAKVKAEGVIIKPFEASDLLSAVAKIAEKYNLNVPQIDPVEVAPEMAAPAETAQAASAAHAPQQVTGYAAAASIAAAEPEPYKPEVPSFLREASAAAAAPAPMFVIEETPDESPLPSFDLSDISNLQESPADSMEDAVPSASADESPLAFSASSVPDPTASGRWIFGSTESAPTVDPMIETITKTEAAVATDPELETTAFAKVEGEVQNLVELEAPSEAPVEVETAADPSLVTDPDELMQFTIKVGTDQEDIPVENDPFLKGVEPASEVTEEAAEPVEQAGGDDTAEFASTPTVAHSFEDDPLVQMGAISITPEPEPLPEVAEPVSEVGDDTMRLSLAQSSGLEGALHEFEATEEAEEELTIVMPEVEDHVAPAPEAIAAAAAESYVEPEVVAEPVIDAAPEFHEPFSEPAAHEVEASLASAMESAAADQQQDSKTLAAAAGRDASQVARAVQKVFERYREQMVADITDELSKGD